MICIVVTSGEELIALLYRLLSPCHEVLCVTQQSIRLPNDTPEILILQTPFLPDCDGKVIYVLGAVPQEMPFSPGTHAVAVISSQNAEALAYAARHHLKTLTCGLSNKDTLTLSSLTDESVVLCLQREIATLVGGVQEPVEIPVRITKAMERFDLLALAAVLLLCGESGQLNKPL